MSVANIIQLVTAILSLATAIILLIREMRRQRKENTGKPATERRPIWEAFRKPVLATVVFLFLVAVVLLSIVLIDISKDGHPGPAPIYGFESGTMGWGPQTAGDSQGVISVAQSKDYHEEGKHSLQLTTDLEGGHATRSKGEAYVTMIHAQNLEDTPITVWVYVPKDALGNPQKPNGIQVFVKDSNWRGEYGAWWNITSETVNKWCEVTLTPSRTAPQGGSVTPEFDPTQIMAVGVKVAIGEGSLDVYKGPIYIDAVDWPE